MTVEQEVIETRREKENLQTVVDTLKQQNKNLQIEKDTEVESLSMQVRYLWQHAHFCYPASKVSSSISSGFLPECSSSSHTEPAVDSCAGREQKTDIRADGAANSGQDLCDEHISRNFLVFHVLISNVGYQSQP